jgi:hypothetical protein
MNADIVGSIDTKVYTRPNGRAVIEQSDGSSVVLSAEQIVAVINDLRACYDYCAAWKEQADDETLSPTERQL